MAKLTEKRDPIPAGTYWVDIDDNSLRPKNLAAFNQWAMDNAPNVKILKKERTMKGSPLDWGGRPQQVWVLFRLVKPVPRWPYSLPIGFPTRADEGAKMPKKSSDTTQREPEKSVKDYWLDQAGLPDMNMPSGGAIVAILLGAWALSRRG